jgi:hypothetical protein
MELFMFYLKNVQIIFDFEHGLHFICGMHVWISNKCNWLCVLLSLASCKTPTVKMVNKVIIREQLQQQLQANSQHRDSIVQLEAQQFLAVLEEHYNRYRPDPTVLEALAARFRENSPIRIEVYGGNWCSDTQEGIPALVRVLDDIGFEGANFQYHRVSRDKLRIDDELQDKSVGSVPLVKVFSGDRNLGSIVEFPQKTWEADLLRIVNSAR